MRRRVLWCREHTFIQILYSIARMVCIENKKTTEELTIPSTSEMRFFLLYSHDLAVGTNSEYIS